MGHGQNELRNAAGLIFKLRIIVAAQFKNQSLYANFSAHPVLVSAPSLRLLWQRHWCVAKRLNAVA